jgi:enoyl-CoA hydratase/carnithine racemase
MHEAFDRLWRAVDSDTEARAVVLTGAGKAFSAGGDLNEFERFRLDQHARARSMATARRLVNLMLDVAVPVVAAVNGPAVGLGCTLTTLCDVVFIADHAFLAVPHVSVALVAGDGGAVTWPALTSLHKAKQYLLTGDRISASDAVALGLANFVVPADAVLRDSVSFAQRLAAQPPQAVQETEALLNQTLRQAAVNSLRYGIVAEVHSHDTDAYGAIVEANRARRESRS